MRRADHIGHAEQGAIRAGLFDEHIERDAADLAAFEPFDERLFVVDAAAGRVDQAHARLHDFDRFGINQIGRLGRERRVDGEVIDLRQHVANFFDARDAQLGGLLGRKERIVTENAHLKGERPLGDFLADAAQADDAQGLVGELRAHERFAVPLAFAQFCVSLCDAP